MTLLCEGPVLKTLLIRDIPIIIIFDMTLIDRFDFFPGIAISKGPAGIFQSLGTVAVFAVYIGIITRCFTRALEFLKALRVKESINPLMNILCAQSCQRLTPVSMLLNLHFSIIDYSAITSTLRSGFFTNDSSPGAS